MSRAIAAALLAAPSILAIVGARRALGTLPAGTAMPALTYSVVDIVPQPYLAGGSETQPAQMRIQVNPVAATIGQVEQIHAAVRTALDWLDNITAAGRRVISVRYAGSGPDDSTDFGDGTTAWTSPADYLVMFE